MTSQYRPTGGKLRGHACGGKFSCGSKCSTPAQKAAEPKPLGPGMCSAPSGPKKYINFNDKHDKGTGQFAGAGDGHQHLAKAGYKMIHQSKRHNVYSHPTRGVAVHDVRTGQVHLHHDDDGHMAYGKGETHEMFPKSR